METESVIQEDEIDSRQYPRYPVEGYATGFAKFPGELLKLKNISANGVCCCCERIFDLDQKFMIALSEPIFSEITQLQVKVIWCRRGEYTWNEVGMQFASGNIDLSGIRHPRARRELSASRVALEMASMISLTAPKVEKSEAKTEKKPRRSLFATKIILGLILLLVMAAVSLYFMAPDWSWLNKMPIFRDRIMVSGIYYEPLGDSFAIINRRVVKEGDFLTEEIKIEKISKKTIMLSTKDGKATLRIGRN